MSAPAAPIRVRTGLNAGEPVAAELRGFEDPVRLHEVRWEEGDR